MAQITAPCGIDCSQCDAFIAAQTNDATLLKKLADNFKKQFDKDIDPSTLNCDGCTQDGRHIGFCAECTIRSCSLDKGYATCAECQEFPCDKGSFIWTKNSKSKETLELLKSNSI